MLSLQLNIIKKFPGKMTFLNDLEH